MINPRYRKVTETEDEKLLCTLCINNKAHFVREFKNMTTYNNHIISYHGTAENEPEPRA
jgi:hypothetical protein